MVTPHRPQLGAVLDALTVTLPGASPPSAWTDAAWTLSAAWAARADGTGAVYPWRTTDPAEAWEILQARDLVPLDCRSRFVCEGCGGSGNGGDVVTLLGRAGTVACHVCRATGHRPHPMTVAALASWASLGWAATDDGHPGIAGAEEWALAMVGVPAVWWRVGPVERDGVVPGHARSDLAAAGFGWSWNGRRPDGVTLVVPPLGA